MRGPIASALGALFAGGARQRNDQSTFRELDVARHSEALPGGLELEWLGTAAFRFRYEGFDLLVDPYVTRPSLRQTFSRTALSPSTDHIDEYVPKANAILVGHTHFDHALDVPRIAELRGARVYGSSSAVKLMRCHGLESLSEEIVPGRVFSVGPFEVTFVESVHAKLVAGLAVPFDGEFSCDHLDGLRGSAFRCGSVYGIHVRVVGATFYHQGSADFLEDRLMHRDVDYFLCGIAGRGFSPRYTERIIRRLRPRVVVPHHFDDFFRPLASTMGFSLNVNLGGFVEEVGRASSDVVVRTLRIGAPWGSAG